MVNNNWREGKNVTYLGQQSITGTGNDEKKRKLELSSLCVLVMLICWPK